MRKWQILEFDGKPYYAFIPEDDEPIKEEDIPEFQDDVDEQQLLSDEEYVDEKYHRPENEDNDDLEFAYPDQESLEIPESKPVVANGKVEVSSSGDSPALVNHLGNLFQVKVEGNVVTLERLNMQPILEAPTNTSAEQKPVEEEPEDEESRHVFDNEEVDNAEEAQLQPSSEELEDDQIHQQQPVVVQVESLKQQQPSSQVAGLRCKVCAETFESTVAFKKHVAWTHKRKVCVQENGLYICSVCDFRTNKKSQFASHLERKHETSLQRGRRQSGANSAGDGGGGGGGGSGSNFPCPACGFVCRSKHSLQSHFIRKHTDRYEHQCKHCPKKFKVKGDLTNHVRFHHKEKPVSCDVCGKLCLNSGSLYVHQKWAHYKPKYECPVCKRRMVTQENLQQHVLAQHERREKIVCAQCGKTFTKKDSFKRHMAVHTGSKPFSCVICAKSFARRSQLRQHLLIHTGKRPFVCDICGKAFTQKPGLICHRKTHPGTHPPLPVMPIGDIVKQFTEEYLAAKQGKTDQAESAAAATADAELVEREFNVDEGDDVEQEEEEEEEEGDGDEEEEEEEEEVEYVEMQLQALEEIALEQAAQSKAKE